MNFRCGAMKSLEVNPDFGLNYLQRIPVLVSTPNRVRESISDWLGAEGFREFIDLTMWSGQTAPGAYQAEWVDGKIEAAHWEGKEWTEIWKALIEGFERKRRHEANQYFILLFTPVARWTESSEAEMERHCLFENRTVYGTFTQERGWEPERQIVIWRADAIFQDA